MNKYHLLLPSVIVALSGCYSEAHYQEQAVASARKYIYENARELTPEQYAFVKLTPPVFFRGTVLQRNAVQNAEAAVSGSGRVQICIAWRIPEQKNDYLVFGVTDSGMSNWSPARLIRRPIGSIDGNALKALGMARDYALSSLHEQMSPAELNFVRFSHPELILSTFNITAPAVSTAVQVPRPWLKQAIPVAGVNGNVQLSLLWKLGPDRWAVFCGVGQPELQGWNIAMAGIFSDDEVKKARLKVVKTPAQYIFTQKKIEKSKKQIPVPAASSMNPSSGAGKAKNDKNTPQGVK